MAEAQENWDRKDPSANVLRLVGNATEYIEKLIQLNVDSSRRERETESRRLDELRAVDREAVKIANAQAVETAETLRKSVENTAITIADQLNVITAEIIKRVAALEKIQNESYGRLSATPDLKKIVDEMSLEQQETKGRSKISTPLMFAMVSLAGGLVMALVIFVIQALQV